MTLSVYISRDKTTALERGFEFAYEREAALQIAKDLWQVYVTKATHYALIANVVNPPIDLLIISNDGIGIIDLKNYNTPISGDEDSAWMVVNDGVRKALECGRHKNPFQQVRSYRSGVYSILYQFAKNKSQHFPTWLTKERQFYIYSAVVFTGEHFDTAGIQLKRSNPWFSLRWQNEVAEWAHTVTFGENNRLSNEQIDLIAREAFQTVPWTEIEGLLPDGKAYAYLWLGDDTNVLAYPLYRDEVTIGRSPDSTIVLPTEGYRLISRKHAVISHTAEGVFIADHNSQNGTWINGKPLRTTHRLERGDRIVLGGCQPDGVPLSGACLLTFKLVPPDIKTTEHTTL
jgi:FHA domain/Nuclease-related domain